MNRGGNMKAHTAARPRVTTLVEMIATGIALFGVLIAAALPAVSQTSQAQAAKAAGAAAPSPELVRAQNEWHQALLQLPHPEPGCYWATYPRVEWIPATCKPGPKYPAIPAHGIPKPFTVGNGGSNDFASNPTGTIIGVDGTFPNPSAGLTETGPIANSGPSFSDTYTLQINANPFTSAACMLSPNPNCKGWEQFVYENNPTTNDVYIQYWLLKYNAACPGAEWTQFQFTGHPEIYCYQSTLASSTLNGHSVSEFGSNNLRFSASVTPSSDQVVITIGGDGAMMTGVNAVDLAAGWTDAEFNVFGDGGDSNGGGQAAFSANSTIVVKNTVHNGTRNAPACDMQSFTGETNNLTLVGMGPIPTQASPAIEFTESNVPGSLAACVTAAGFGDTHLTTFDGLLYDFQAAGDFLLTQAEGFTVENRQVSGAPTWPNATVNKAVATQMGNTRVAVCTEPSRIFVDGREREIGEGQIISLPGGVGILHTGNVYLVQDETSGDGIRAENNGAYINLTVGLGHWPVTVRGVLANANGNVNAIEAQTGVVLVAPFEFNQFYHEFTDSWRVPEKDSLLAPCGENVVTGIPQEPFYANNLPPQLRERAQRVCAAAGIREKALLEACIIDVAFTGREEAAKVYVGMRAPVAVGQIVTSGSGGRDGGNGDGGDKDEKDNKPYKE
jgi:hypothetical protein